MDNICTICFENDCSANLCKLRCSHQFHMPCILQWLNLNISCSSNIEHERVSAPQCPYCRRIALVENIPDTLDTFYKFYYFTKFVRKKCSFVFCSHSEFPCNDGKCSSHYYPLIDKHDLKIIMDKLFCFFFLPLNLRKMLLYFAIQCFDHNLKFETLFHNLEKILIEHIETKTITNQKACSLISEFSTQNGINLQNYYL
jgi:hypothetical protein